MRTDKQLFEAEKQLPLPLNLLYYEQQNLTDQVWNSPPFPTTGTEHQPE